MKYENNRVRKLILKTNHQGEEMDAIFELTVIDNGGSLRTLFSESSIANRQPA